jgi:MoaA/NifB/PqqE/SkfB family radical SAM enzyme
MRRPLNIILDVTSRCNLKCRMCYFSGTDELRFKPYDAPAPPRGTMPLETFTHVADQLFPHAWRVALACAAEPLMHPAFREVLAIAATHRVPDLWFPTNLLLLTEATSRAIVDAGVRTVGVSIDGVDAATYESIRTGARWDRVLDRLELLKRVRDGRGSKLPRLRLIFTWMRSNFDHLRRLPELASRHGFSELDVRFVSPTVGVDNSAELLTGHDRLELDAALEATARDAVRRGIRLTSFPEFTSSHRRSLVGKARHRVWLLRAGIDRPEYWRHAAHERAVGCGYPLATYVIRPNGAVFPCQFWQEEPLGMVPQDDRAALATSPLLERIVTGLEAGSPVGTCATCDQRRDAFYRPLRAAEPAS